MPDNVLKSQYFLQLTPEKMPKYKNNAPISSELDENSPKLVQWLNEEAHT